jgi:hypothetical protein
MAVDFYVFSSDAEPKQKKCTNLTIANPLYRQAFITSVCNDVAVLRNIWYRYRTRPLEKFFFLL